MVSLFNRSYSLELEDQCDEFVENILELFSEDLNYLDNCVVKIMEEDSDTINLFNHFSKPTFKQVLGFKPRKLIEYFELSFSKNTSINSSTSPERLFFIKRYKKFRASRHLGFKKWFDNLDMAACPYCAASYLKLVDNRVFNGRFQIDHYYPKSKYPLFALSFYNLIPCCSYCNHNKLVSVDGFYPYNIDKDSGSSEDITVSLDRLSYISCILNRKYFEKDVDFNVRVKFKSKKQSLIDVTVEDLYNSEKEIVSDLIWKSVYLTKTHRTKIIQLLQGSGFFEKRRIEEILLGFSKSDGPLSKPYQKFKLDVGAQLHII